MSSQSLDIVLSAIDRTGPAVNSAIGNLGRFDQAVTSVGSSGGDGGGFISGIVGSLFSVSGMLTAAAGAAAVFSAAMITNVGGARDFVVNAASSIASYVGEAVSSVATSVGSTLKSMADGTYDWAALFKSVVTGVVTGFAVVEYTFTHFGDVMELIWTTSAYEIVKFGNQIEYVFTKAIPGYLKWFGDNWHDVFETVWNFTKTIVANMHENLVNFFSNIFLYLSGHGDEANWEWTGLLEGFENTIKQFPGIVDREIGPIEKSLDDMRSAIATKVGTDLNAHIAERVSHVPDIMKGISKFGHDAWDWLKSFSLSDLLGGDEQKKDPGLTLPGLRNERFTTGVTATQESPEVKAINKGNALLVDIAQLFGIKLPSIVKDGVKAGVETAKTGGFMGFRL